MIRLPLLLLTLASLSLVAAASEKPNTVLVHPGEVIYARFEEHGKKLRLLNFSKEQNEQAQLILSLEQDPKGPDMTLKLQNRFAKDMIYKAEMRSLTQNARLPVVVYPVVTGKMSFDKLAPRTEEVAVFGFELIL